MRVLKQISSRGYNTFRTTSTIKEIAFPETEEELVSLIIGSRPFWLIGMGSNLLFPDEPVTDLVICTREMRKVVTNENGFYAAAGAPLPFLASKALGLQLSGLEFACAIPGSLGGAILSNAGAHSNSLENIVNTISVFDPFKQTIRTLTKKEIGFGYRTTRLPQNCTVLSANLNLKLSTRSTIKATMKENLRARRTSQPQKVWSAGSIFKNPPRSEFSAGSLIEQCGLKGKTCGDAAVSKKHANFIVNRGEASASDIVTLMRTIRDTVKEQFQIQLKPEIQFIGWKHLPFSEEENSG